MYVDLKTEQENIWRVVADYEECLINLFNGQACIPKELQDNIDDAKFALHVIEENLLPNELATNPSNKTRSH